MEKRKNKINKAEIDELLSQLDCNKDKLTLAVQGHQLSLTNLDKVLWPVSKGSPITKRDYLMYLLKVAPVLLPHLKDRPLTLIRYPNGIIKGPRFFQKQWDAKLPGFVDSVRYYSVDSKKDQDYLICNNLATLVWLAQVASLELHTSHSRTSTAPDARKLSGKLTGSEKAIKNSVLNYPDFVVVDLDPYIYSGKENKGDEPELNRKAFRRVCDIALRVKELLDQIGAHSYLKTSGRTGLHIYIPIIRNMNYDEVRSFAEALGKYLLQETPRQITMDWSVKKRIGKVFFDHNMNVRGKTLASIYSARNTVNATVATPIDWDELESIYPNDFNIKNVPKRIKERGDLWADILKNKVDLRKLLSRSPLEL
jgi:bifunctional non-homologous end joining protein LigD